MTDKINRRCKECGIVFEAAFESIRTSCSDCCDEAKPVIYCECKTVKNCINFRRNRDAANPFICGAFDGGPREHNSEKVPDFCPDLEDPNQLPTKAELMAKTQAACEAMIPYCGGVLSIEECSSVDNALIIMHTNTDNKSYLFSRFVSYRPDVVAPPKGFIVISDRRFSRYPFLSEGFLADKCGSLKATNDNGDCFLNKWFCPSTGQKSANWLDEWTPEEFRK